MSKHLLRHDPICQNCGETVERRFCPNCGQENTETRQSFGHLLRHFVEDITHYDSGFWLTIKSLLFRPAYLTKEYLKGRRISFVPPVRLYIFISFITFLLPVILPNHSNKSDFTEEEDKEWVDTVKRTELSIGSSDLGTRVLLPNIYKSEEQMDSVEDRLPESKRLHGLSGWVVRHSFHLKKYSPYELGEKFIENITHNIPKALFIYMPLFALVLWLFHDKKRWLYFDHAIFTIHYFSLFLLLYNVMTLSGELLFFHDLLFTVRIILLIILIIALVIYFFKAHARMYEERKWISFMKSVLISSVNFIVFTFVWFWLILVSVFIIH